MTITTKYSLDDTVWLMHKNRATTRKVISVWIDGAKFKRYLLPGNFWRWTRKAQLHYILKRWPAACCYHNATPPDLSGRKLSWISSAERQRFDHRTTTCGARTYVKAGSRVGKSHRPPLPPTK